MHNMENYIRDIGKLLTKSDNFKRVCDISRSDIPPKTGLYAIAINDVYDIGRPFRDDLIERKHNLLYIGKSQRTLRERLWDEDLHHENPAAFFRSIGAALGFRPVRGSSKNGKNYKFSTEDTEIIKNWIDEHLSVNYVDCPIEMLDETEKKLISNYLPLLNHTHNPKKSKRLSEVKKECRDIAMDK